jgi:3-deoxy-D-manno-octulosonic-acid transferase
VKWIYSILVQLYHIFIAFAALFHQKARLLHQGKQQTWELLASQLKNNVQPTIWLHAASLGEFEQARPLIEALKQQQQPNYKIVVTFFSPSGYEVRKNYELADVVCYLPADTATNAQRFLDIVQPQQVFFIKYEFWFHYIDALKKRQIPLFLVSGIFRENQIFFKRYGKFFREMLLSFEHFFVQNQTSFQLLQAIGLKNVTITGDTRFDRVITIAQNANAYPLVETFCQDKPVFVVGSAWEQDTDLLLPFLNNMRGKMKVIIAPHAIRNSYMSHIEQKFEGKTVYYSQLNHTANFTSADLLFIDNIGMLAGLYRYAHYAWIGGGLAQGLHNTLEAAVFGIPVFFGNKKYQNFDEAHLLLQAGAGFCCGTTDEFKNIFFSLWYNPENYQKAAKAAHQLVAQNNGATQKIMQYLQH